MKNNWRIATAAFALCLALAGCGGSKTDAPSNDGGGKSDTVPTQVQVDPREAFAGDWEVVRLDDQDESESISEEQFDQMRELGINFTLTLNMDGTATLMSGEDAMNGTWEATKEGEGTISLDGGRATLELNGSELILTEQTDVIYFRPYDASAAGDDVLYFGGNDVSDLDNPTSVNVAVADDDVCTIKLTAMGDYAGDPGYYFEITNHTDQDLIFMEGSGWTIGGAAFDPILIETVRAGETLGTIMWFNAGEVGTTDPTQLHDIHGTIEVMDVAMSNVLGSYEVTID